MDTKETIMTYVKQFDTDAATGFTPDRTKRTIFRRLNRWSDAKQAYSELIAEGEIHEQGTGRPGSPIIVAIGPAEVSKPIVPQPWSFVEHLALLQFMLRIADIYESKGWGQPDLPSEINKAFQSYEPGRPY